MIEATKESIEGKQSAFLSSDRLLGEQEREQCQRLAAGDSTYSRRAQALLALDQGATQKEAGQLAELSPGTVRYWLGRFRDMRMAIFPETSARRLSP